MSAASVWARRLAPTLAGLIVLAIALETTLRVAGPVLPGSYRTGPIIEPDLELGWRNIPGSVTWVRSTEFVAKIDVNGQGRPGPLIGERRPSVRRVLVLGDSYAMGDQVAYDRSVIGLTATRLGGAFEFINDAVPGYGTDQELLVLRRDLALRPDAIVLIFSVVNDVQNDHRPLESIEAPFDKPYFEPSGSGIALVPGAREIPPGTRLKATVARSALLSVVKTGLVDHLIGAATNEPLQRLQLGVLEKPAGEWERAWRIAALLVSEVAREARALDLPAILVIAPHPCQVHADTCAGRPDLATSTVPQEILTDIASRSGFVVVDLLPELRRRAAADTRTYWRWDPHWTEEGHAVAAEGLTAALAPLR